MGTNYYLQGKVCVHCGVADGGPLHIGKSSAGWNFGLRIYPEGEDSWPDVGRLIIAQLAHVHGMAPKRRRRTP